MAAQKSSPRAIALLTSKRFWIGFIAACAMLFVLDHVQDVANSVLNASVIYQRLLTAGFKPLYPRNTTIIEIRNGREPADVTLVNVCQQRLFLSRLLEVVGNPKVAATALVIDKVFSREACRSTNTCSPTAACDGTPKLQETVRVLLKDRVRIIVGRQFEYDESQDPPLKLLPSLEFPTADTGERVVDAALNLDDDTRRAALVWSGRGEGKDGSIVQLETLGFRAAASRDSKLLDVNSRLRSFYKEPHGPFAGFLPSGAFDDYTFSAIEVLCGRGSGPKTEWQTCAAPDQAALASMRGRVILIGENYSGVDQHDTVVGIMPGVRLWANYVEAIFDDNLFDRVPNWITYLFGFVVLLSLELVKRTLRSYQRAAAIAMVVAGTYLICYFVVRTAGYYLNPAVGIVGAVFSYIGQLVTSRFVPGDSTG